MKRKERQSIEDNGAREQLEMRGLDIQLLRKQAFT